MERQVLYIWLSLACGAGSEMGSSLLAKYGTPENIYALTDAEIESLDFIDGKVKKAIRHKALDEAKEIYRHCKKTGIGILTPEDGQYPDRLRAIYAKPLVLYYKGRLPDFDRELAIAVVGTRKCSDNGRELAYRLGYDLGTAGAVTVSGMALGIDGESHMGALDAKGMTVAVLGCGVDRIYPPAHKDLMQRLIKKGAVLSEFTPDTEPTGKNFPIRNRIISGLCQGTVVVEAGLYSGAMITAKDALYQGRDMFAYPGDANDELSEGANTLIQDGAHLVMCARDILMEYAALYKNIIFPEKLVTTVRRDNLEKAVHKKKETFSPGRYRHHENQNEDNKTEEKIKVPKIEEPEEIQEPERDYSDATAEEKEILSVMHGAVTVEELAFSVSKKKGSACDISKLLETLTMLEIEGYIEALPGGSYKKL